MMTFYSAAGSFQIRKEGTRKRPYIQRLGKLHLISVPEFAIWSTLLWQVMTHEELEKNYLRQMEKVGIKAPDLDTMLGLLIERKLVLCGEGYTGMDALYNMLSEAFVLPVKESRGKQVVRGLGLVTRGRMSLQEFCRAMKRESFSENEEYVLNLVHQTPLSVAELIQCFSRKVQDVSTPQKVIAAIYPEEDDCQATLTNKMYPSQNTKCVLETVANLYLQRHVVLERVF